MRELLVVFTRYPELGKCKTRLIGELTEAEATELHTRMVQHTLQWARALQQLRPQVAVQVHFYGGDAASMKSCFGDFDYQEQIAGDLGQKMRGAVEQGWTQGFKRAVIVGTDSPQLNENTIARVLALLSQVNVAIVPAVDGGYVAIGLSRCLSKSALPALFAEKAWGTEKVLQQTLDSLAQIPSETLALLPPHADVDHPEDIEMCELFLGGFRDPKPSISVLIPVWGAEPSLQRCLAAVTAHADPKEHRQDIETVISVRGPWRQAAETAYREGSAVVCGGANSRGEQLNQAKQMSQGEIVCCLHADTILPESYDRIIKKTILEDSFIAGAFKLSIAARGWRYRMVEIGVSVRCRLLNLPYGDQALFLARQTLERLGGFDEVPIMEDYRLVKKLKKLGKIEVLKSPVQTSARRWKKLGVIKVTLINQLMLFGHAVGISPERLADFYRGRQANKD